MKNQVLADKFNTKRTPFYYYDTALLGETLSAVIREASRHEGFKVHYAVKANANPKVLRLISGFAKDSGDKSPSQTFGADCVSGGEIAAAIKAGFAPSGIVFAGVGKADWEINLALDNDIFCFNVESVPELEVINELAEAKGKVARVCFRVNPDVGAHTHANITTGLAENKFGIAMGDLLPIIRKAETMVNVDFLGLHFHIGSQILDMTDFKNLCQRINELQDKLEAEDIKVSNINVGGGLGIDYDNPDGHPIPDFKQYFDTYAANLRVRSGQHVHFELGRSIVGQMGSLITRVLYIKQGTTKRFCIVDAGMSDLIRPALYHASHKIEDITSDAPLERYDVVGPICESSDVFGKDVEIAGAKRGDLIAIRSAGAYGETMTSQYNCRPLPEGYVTEDF